MSYGIYVPTFKRAGKVTTLDVLPEATLVVSESQVDSYKESYPKANILACPDNIEGNIARKRNWIMGEGFKEHDGIIMVDDDVVRFQFIENTKQNTLEGEHLREVFENGFIMCEDLGAKMWGMNIHKMPKSYMEMTPFNFTSPILGNFYAMLKHPLRYDERLSLKEDYDMSLQMLHKYHKVLRFNKYHCQTTHNTNDGGCVDYRTMVQEEKQNELLQKKWGKGVVKYNMKKGLHPQIKVPIAGV